MENMILFNIPEEVMYIINKFNNSGYEAYAVGGCIRDVFLGVLPNDWDITTNAKVEDIKHLFSTTIKTNTKHGTIIAVVNKNNYEISTYKSSPTNVSSITSDLGLRDFTMNAMAYHPQKGLLDPFLGLEDIKKSTIRTVGDPFHRLNEDPLRMLRAIRFSAELGFEIDAFLLNSIKENCTLIKRISPERIENEISKILISDRIERFIILRETGLLAHIIPEFDLCFDVAQNHPYHIHNVAIHSLCAAANIDKDRILRWAMLLHDIGKSVTKTTDSKGIDHFYGHSFMSVGMAKNILERYHFSNAAKDRILRLIKYHDRPTNPNYKAVRKAVGITGIDLFLDLLKVQEADKRGQNPVYLEKGLNVLGEIKKIYYDIKNKKQCLTIKDLAINGHDLLSMGMKQGKEIGFILNKLLNYVLKNPDHNKKEILVGLVDDMKKSIGI